MNPKGIGSTKAGSSRSPGKVAAAQANGLKGGRPLAAVTKWPRRVKAAARLNGRKGGRPRRQVQVAGASQDSEPAGTPDATGTYDRIHSAAGPAGSANPGAH